MNAMKQSGLLVLLLLCLAGRSQNGMPANALFRPLKIGDTVPDVRVMQVSNYKSRDFRLSELRGKLVILDFWFGACPGCYIVFPKLEALQEKFGDKIQVMTVNFESRETINSTFQRLGRTSTAYRLPRLPTILNDTVFHRLFPVVYYPHEVWIDGNGVVVATTAAEDLTEDRIVKLLHKEPMKVDMKIDRVGFNDYKQPVLPQVYPDDPHSLRYYSAILRFIPGAVGNGVTKIVDPAANTVRITRTNRTILDFFTEAVTPNGVFDPFNSPAFDFGKRVEMKVKDSSRYLYLPSSGLTKGEWKAQNSYTYEAVYPTSQQNRWQANMLLDLERYFSVSCRVEKRKLQCLALVRTSDRDRLKSKESRVASIYDPRNDPTRFQLFFGKTTYLLNAIAQANRGTPYIFADKTDYEGRIDVDLSLAVLGDLPQLKEELRRGYDLDLIEREAEVNVLVFEER